MTREILFRGKWTRNGKWIKGFYARIHDGKGNVSHRIYTGYAESDCGDFYPENFEVDPSTVGQFVSMCDKNGKKIFEGDIVAIERGCETVKYHVFFDPQICGFVGDSINHVGFTTFEDNGMYMAVVGNKWDNPELLEGEE